MNKIILKTEIDNDIIDLSEFVKNIKYIIDNRTQLMRIEIIFENSNDYLFNEFKEHLEYISDVFDCVFYIRNNFLDFIFDFICLTKIKSIETTKDLYIVTARIEHYSNRGNSQIKR